MSRSYRKSPIDKCGSDFKFGKRQANKRVRHTTIIVPNGKTYKKLYCSWNICDCRYGYWNNPNLNKFSRSLQEEFDKLGIYAWEDKFQNVWREKARRK